MNDEQLQTLEQVKDFIEGSQEVEFRGLNAREKYTWIEEVLKRFRYPKLKKEGKGLIKSYLLKVTGYSRAQLTRLIGIYQQIRHDPAGEISTASLSRRATVQKTWLCWLKPMNYMVGSVVRPPRRYWSVRMRFMAMMNMPILPRYQ